jgi:hypothetical protein
MAEATHTFTRRFLLLPFDIREEVYKHLLPQNKVYWLTRNATSPHPRDESTLQATEFHNPYWKRRQLERLALSHWYPEAAAKADETGNNGLAPTGGYMYSHNGQEVRDLMAMRLVCQQTSTEVSELIHRNLTLWWTLWDAEMAFVQKLLRLEDEDIPHGMTVLTFPGIGRWLTSLQGASSGRGRFHGYHNTSEEQWSSFVQHRRNEGLLQWISRFRNVNIVIQDSAMMEGFHLVQSLLRIIQPRASRLPTTHFVVCGFFMFFNQNRNDWQVLMKDGRNKAEDDVLEATWEGSNTISGKDVLTVRRVEEEGGRLFWLPREPDTPLGAYQFGKVPFTADATYGESSVAINGSLLFYSPKAEDEKTLEQLGIVGV